MIRLLPLLLLAMAARADDHAVILVYHHVDRDTPTSTSVTPEAFARHLDYLDEHDFTVVPLEQLLDALAERRPLPANSVAITFDDAYLSVYNVARPMLEVRGWPYTVFVSTGPVDAGYENYMSWEQLRRIVKEGAGLGNHGVTHRSALERNEGESVAEWLARFREDAVQAQERIGRETGVVSRVFAWPYGEFNARTERLIDELGWYAVGQQSGAAGYMTPLTAVPRYPLSTNFADDAAFAMRVNSEPLPVDIRAAPDHLLATGKPAPTMTFRLSDGPFNLSSVTCYNSRGDRLAQTESTRGELTVSSPEPLARGRSKYTCTAPRRDKPGVFGWYSHLWVVP